MAVKVTLGPKGRNAQAGSKDEAILRNRKKGIGRTVAMTTINFSDIEAALYSNRSAT